MTDQQHPVTDIRMCHRCHKPVASVDAIERPHKLGRQWVDVSFHPTCWRLTYAQGDGNRFRRRTR